jgi:hypothetical protein
LTNLFTQAGSGAIASSSDYNANFLLVQESIADTGPWVISGLTLSAGAGLAVTVAAGTASIGGRITASGSFSIAGLTDGSLNYLYLKDDGTGTSNLTGTNPADSVKLGTATTSGGAVTSTSILRSSGRQLLVRHESQVPGAVGSPGSISLASWAAAAADSIQVYGTLPAGALPSISFNDLSDVTVSGAARGALVYKGAGDWLNLPAGTNDYYLKAQGAGADPTWAALPTSLSGDVTLAPATSTRNVIQPTGDFIALSIAANASQTNPLQQWKDTAGTAQARITATGLFSSPHGPSSERFGLAASAVQTQSTALGNQANAAGFTCVSLGYQSASGAASKHDSVALGAIAKAESDRAIAIGFNARATADYAIAIGRSSLASAFGAFAFGGEITASGVSCMAIGNASSATNDWTTVFGDAAVGSGLGATAIGRQATSSATASIALGYLCVASHASSIAMGVVTNTTATNQLVIGGPLSTGDDAISTVFIGSGVTSTVPRDTTYNASGGSGSNIAGANLILAGGRATGSANGGDVLFQTTIAGSSSSTANSLQEKLRLNCDGKVIFTQRTSTSDQTHTEIVPTWATSTDASRKGRTVFNIYDTAAREAFRMEASGSAPMLGFLGAVAVARPAAYTLTGSATRTLPTDPSGAYTGIDNLQVGTVYATVADLNTLRGAVSSLLGVVRQLLTDLGHNSGFGLVNA